MSECESKKRRNSIPGIQKKGVACFKFVAWTLSLEVWGLEVQALHKNWTFEIYRGSFLTTFLKIEIQKKQNLDRQIFQ